MELSTQETASDETILCETTWNIYPLLLPCRPKKTSSERHMIYKHFYSQFVGFFSISLSLSYSLSFKEALMLSKKRKVKERRAKNDEN